MKHSFERSWYKYNNLEKELVDSTRYVPLMNSHNIVWSEFLGDLLVKVGNTIDSFFRFAYTNDTGKPHSSCDINNFRDFFEPKYQLSGVLVEAAYGLTEYGSIKPFKEFNSNIKPKWWDAYNHVKHEWFDCLQEATLENTLNALAGLFILNILYKESQKHLIRSSDVFFADYLRKEDIEKALKDSYIGVPIKCKNFNFVARTQLFTHILRIDENIIGSEIYYVNR